MLAVDDNWESGFDGEDFAHNVTVTGSVVLDGRGGAVGKGGEDASVVHVVIDRIDGDRMTKVLEIFDGCAKEVEGAKVTVGFGSEGAGRFGSGVASNEGGEGGA